MEILATPTPDVTDDDLAERTAAFRTALAELKVKPAELAKRLQAMDDYRTVSAIVRSIQRMECGDTAVSGEILVILKLLVRQQRTWRTQEAKLQWREFPNGTVSAVCDDFTISLSPQSKGRWHVNLVHNKTGYSPTWPSWQKDLETAKMKAIACLEDARNDLFEMSESSKQ